jgi:hypothetical protein
MYFAPFILWPPRQLMNSRAFFFRSFSGCLQHLFPHISFALPFGNATRRLHSAHGSALTIGAFHYFAGYAIFLPL